MDESDENPADAFIERWRHADGSERANYQLFLTELCALLGLDRPDPASVDTEENAYVFERKVSFRTRAQTKKVQELLETLVALGQVHRNHDGCYIFGG
jgi:hypothetical protein